MANSQHSKRLVLKVALLLVFLFAFEISRAQPSTLSPSMISYISNTSLSVRDVHTDCEGNIVYVGGTGASAYAVSPNTISSKYNGGNSDVFIVKIDSTGVPLWKTLLGGNLYDRAYAVEIDNEGFIYVAGRAGTGLATTPCALQSKFAGDNNANPAYGIQDGFITKITPDGSTIVWSTYIGCDGRGFVRDIDVDSKGNVWAGISNTSPNFPHITKNAVQTTATASMNPALIKLSSDGRTLLYGTFLSDGDPTSAGPTTVRIDKQDNVFFLSHASKNNLPITPGAFQPTAAGNIDFVVSKFDSTGNLLFCSFLGGPGIEEVETHSLEIDTGGNVVVAAYTYASGYPIVGNAVQTTFKGVRDGVLTKISANGSAIIASTYLGGNQVDEIQGVGIDANNNIYVTGRTASSNFPVTKAIAYQQTIGGASDGHVSVLSPDLSTILYSTYIGGSGNEDIRACHVDVLGKVHAGGSTASNNFPTRNAFDTTLTGSLTGAALVFRPNTLFQATPNCVITNTFKDPCVNTAVVESAKENATLIVYPNPASELLSINLGNDLHNNEVVRIYNLLGILMREIKIEQSTQINLADLPKGLYYIDFLHRVHQSTMFVKL